MASASSPGKRVFSTDTTCLSSASNNLEKFLLWCGAGSTLFESLHSPFNTYFASWCSFPWEFVVVRVATATISLFYSLFLQPHELSHNISWQGKRIGNNVWDMAPLVRLHRFLLRKQVVHLSSKLGLLLSCSSDLTFFTYQTTPN
jgi:hypothetical protein